jgi:peptide/nickel transport system substrate-binding protein
VSRAARARRRAAGLVSLALLAVTCTSQGAKASKNAIQAAPAAPSAPSTTVGVRKGGSLNYAAGQEPPGFNVNTSAAGTPATRAVMDQLWPSVFDVGPDFKVTLNRDLMVSAVLTKQSPQTVVLKIDPQASWSDGVPITADDFIYFWQRQRDPAHTTDSCTDPKCPTNGKPIDDSSDGTGYRNIESVTGTDEGKTVTVVFSAPFADWRLLWSNIVPAHMAQKVGWNSGFDSADPNVVVSGGPFKIQSSTRART